MFTHPEVRYLLARQHEKELIDQASRYRLVATLSRGRHRRRVDLGLRVGAVVRRVVAVATASAPRPG